MLEVRVLGGLAVELDGRSVSLPADARARELLGWLVVAPGVHARSVLAGRLRPDVAEESARKTLRDAVYELRRAFGPVARNAIVATRDRVGLEPALVRADLWEFRRLVAADELEAAVEGRMGELLAGMDADWVLGCYCSTELFLGRLAATLGRLEEAEARLRRAIAVNDAAGSPTFAAISLLRLARVLAERGDMRAARDALTETVARAEALAMPALAAEATAATETSTRTAR